MGKTYFCQCRLSKKNGNASTTSQVTWIPEKFAKIGDMLKLKNNDVWVDGWKVESVGGRLEEAMLPDPHNDIKAHRKSTGDSLRKS